MSMLQLLGGVAVAGAVAAGSTALTGSGLSMTPSANQFVGGSIDQNITGANVDTIVYHYTDTTKTQVDYLTVTLTGAASKALTMSATGTGFGASGATKWLCDDGTTTPTGSGSVPILTGAAGAASTNSVVCTATDNAGSPTGYFAGMTKLTVAVA
ncbi:hypothetical protein [Actinoplanes sp. NPDC051411]|uniref:hypothetical protein n=1 Tax=Actinoplanes sp. NPDC051411 TaxID=3155522 RepID=UPI00342BA90F